MRETVDLVLEAKYILTMNHRRNLIIDGAVAVDGDKIIDVGRRDEIEKRFRGEETLSYDKAAILPGFIDAHTHNSQT
ncbi:MAG TPA: amidohydrolase, partial [Nitrososphaeria archaeon]|nr:amidohydrolase [Nitrososphaeria archaeon]